jgi:hypothetical protein
MVVQGISAVSPVSIDRYSIESIYPLNSIIVIIFVLVITILYNPINNIKQSEKEQSRHFPLGVGKRVIILLFFHYYIPLISCQVKGIRSLVLKRTRRCHFDHTYHIICRQ